MNVHENAVIPFVQNGGLKSWRKGNHVDLLDLAPDELLIEEFGPRPSLWKAPSKTLRWNRRRCRFCKLD